MHHTTASSTTVLDSGSCYAQERASARYHSGCLRLRTHEQPPGVARGTVQPPAAAAAQPAAVRACHLAAACVVGVLVRSSSSSSSSTVGVAGSSRQCVRTTSRSTTPSGTVARS